MRTLLTGFNTPEVVKSEHGYSKLCEHVDEDQIPAVNGGSSPYKLEEYPFQNGMDAMVSHYYFITNGHKAAPQCDCPKRPKLPLEGANLLA